MVLEIKGDTMKTPIKPICIELACLLYEIHKYFYTLSTDQYSEAKQELNDMAYLNGYTLNDLAKILVHPEKYA